MSKWSKEVNIHDAGHWLAKKIDLIELKDYNISKNNNINILRGGIFNTELGIDNIGGEKNKKRPCLVLSRNNLNLGDTVTIIPLTTKFSFNRGVNGEKSPKYSNHYVLLKSKYSFLSDDSCIKCEDIWSVDKVRLCEHLGNIDINDLNMIKNKILYTLGF